MVDLETSHAIWSSLKPRPWDFFWSQSGQMLSLYRKNQEQEQEEDLYRAEYNQLWSLDNFRVTEALSVGLVTLALVRPRFWIVWLSGNTKKPPIFRRQFKGGWFVAKALWDTAVVGSLMLYVGSYRTTQRFQKRAVGIPLVQGASAVSHTYCPQVLDQIQQRPRTFWQQAGLSDLHHLIQFAHNCQLRTQQAQAQQPQESSTNNNNNHNVLVIAPPGVKTLPSDQLRFNGMDNELGLAYPPTDTIQEDDKTTKKKKRFYFF